MKDFDLETIKYIKNKIEENESELSRLMLLANSLYNFNIREELLNIYMILKVNNDLIKSEIEKIYLK